MAKRAQKIDRQQARKSRRKGGKRRKGSAVAAHCIHCRQRPAVAGTSFLRAMLLAPRLRRTGLPLAG